MAWIHDPQQIYTLGEEIIITERFFESRRYF